MTGNDVALIRGLLGLTQTQLAPLLGYRHGVRVSEIERTGVADGGAVGLLLAAYRAGYRPDSWPK